MTAIAVVIVAHGSEDDLARTLPALLPQLHDGDETVVVDNGGENGALPASVKVLRGPANDGFAGGAARGAAATRAPLLLFLNPDAMPLPGCLDALREAPDDWAAWQALVLLPNGEVNTSGNVAHWLGLGWAGTDAPPPSPEEVGFASGAALVVRRDAWESVGGFDPDYFMYGEDLDLGLRLHLAGHGVGIVPAARVEHGYAFHKGDYKWFYLERNRWWTVLAVYPWSLLLLVLPALVALEVVLLVVAARDGWLAAKLRSQAAVLRSLPRIAARRRRVHRRVGAAAFARILSSHVDSPYLALPAPAARAQALYWTCVLRLIAAPDRK